MSLRRMAASSRRYRHFSRYRRIIAVMVKYGFGEFLYRLNLLRFLGLVRSFVARKRVEGLETMTRAERVRMALEELGPTFVKMGQILSLRPDLIPLEFIGELSKLQDSVTPFPFEEAKKIVEFELKNPISNVFASFAEGPLAAASIGQVHRARLRSGEEVVVKVQRPGIRRTVETDIEILQYLARLAERYIEEMKDFRPGAIVEEFARTIRKEMDYAVEASHLERFARQFRGNDALFVPAVFREFSTGKLLTMEYVEGIGISEVARLDEAGFDRKLLAARGVDLMLEQVFKHGFFHADPHPGNILVLPGNVISYLDFGMMGSVDRKRRGYFVEVIAGFADKDASKMAGSLLKIVEWDEEPDRRRLERDIAEYADLYLYRPIKEWRIKNLVEGMLALLSRHRLRIPPDIFLMLKTIAEVEGLGRLLDPDFELLERARPFARRMHLERMNPKRLFEGLSESGGEIADFLKETPGDLRDILKQWKQGRTRIGFEHRGLERFIFEMDRSSNRIAFSLIVSSLIVGSSLIVTADIGPHLYGFPVLGVAGFSVAGLFGMWLVISIFRSGRL